MSLRLDLPEGTTALPPEAATSLVKQQSLAYILYPLLPGLASLGAADKAASGSVGPSDRALLQGLVFLRAPDPYVPLPLRIIYRGSAGERTLALVGPGARPL